ncbi:hypothetical protein [Spiroplasma taiwanense]|uniref:Uncharacterized protein n=1 Tax=Spiroplasma taiwanense CT-1 TaxID=1276220 RepID=S5MHV6_9MOLU|nr:hypothetical protein [Spiroplasma taiwanense]AGR41470.1 hypothetical protein STAIW_v1c08840 [Spiroplasma taiwanense CT-1]
MSGIKISILERKVYQSQLCGELFNLLKLTKKELFAIIFLQCPIFNNITKKNIFMNDESMEVFFDVDWDSGSY